MFQGSTFILTPSFTGNPVSTITPLLFTSRTAWLRHQFYKLNSTGISADVLRIKAPNASLVKQSTSKPQSQSTVNSHNIKQRKKRPKTQSANFSSTFCFRPRSKTSSISSTRVPSQKLSSATFTNQSFSHLPISQPSAICLLCLPGST